MAALMTLYSQIDPTTYFFLTLVLVVLGAIASSLLMGFFGLVSTSSPHLIQSLTAGQGLAGMVPSLVQIILILFEQSPNAKTKYFSHEKVAFYHFVITAVIAFATLFGFLAMEANPEYFNKGTASVKYTTVPSDEPNTASEDEFLNLEDIEETLLASETYLDTPISFWTVFHYILPFSFSVFLTFSITLSLFPAITSAIVSLDKDSAWKVRLFVPLHFVVYNKDFIGKSLPVQIMLKTPFSLMVMSSARLCFIPLLLLCNIHFGSTSNQNGIFGDTAYILILFAFSLSNGWLGTNILMKAPGLVVDKLKLATNTNFSTNENNVDREQRLINRKHTKSHLSSLCGDLMMFSLSVGLAFGSVVSLSLSYLLQNY
ncbi:hypothetical protein HK096_002985 [Nowakowskiella sp. JEL0078]|nr:hypothetical protein HK096_002985 [Nowakowskiella sp. JEL0078]